MKMKTGKALTALPVFFLNLSAQRTNITCDLWSQHHCAAGVTSLRQRRNISYLISPLPSMRYFSVVSARKPIGPLAWSFCVEIPISAP